MPYLLIDSLDTLDLESIGLPHHDGGEPMVQFGDGAHEYLESGVNFVHLSNEGGDVGSEELEIPVLFYFAHIDKWLHNN